jgi:hypothetical protein
MKDVMESMITGTFIGKLLILSGVTGLRFRKGIQLEGELKPYKHNRTDPKCGRREKIVRIGSELR